MESQVVPSGRCFQVSVLGLLVNSMPSHRADPCAGVPTPRLVALLTQTARTIVEYCRVRGKGCAAHLFCHVAVKRKYLGLLPVANVNSSIASARYSIASLDNVHVPTMLGKREGSDGAVSRRLAQQTTYVDSFYLECWRNKVVQRRASTAYLSST